MKRTFNLGQEAWAAAGAEPFPLRPIPDSFMSDDYRVCWLLFMFELDLTTGAGGGATQEEILRWISNITLTAAEHNIVNLNAWDLFNFLTYSHPDLFAFALPVGIAASQTNAQVNAMLAIPIENQQAAEAQDYVMPASMFNDAELQFTFGGAAGINANTTVNSCITRVWASVDRKNEVQIPSMPTIAAVNLDLFDQLPPGIYDTLFMMAKDVDTNFSAAGLTNIHVTAAGEQIHGSVIPDAVLAHYLFDHGCGAESGVIGWTDNAATFQRLPLIWPANHRRSNRLSAFIDTRGTALVLNHSGSDSAHRYIYRYYKPITAEGTMHRLGKMGVAEPQNVATKPKTMSKKPMTTNQRLTRPGLSAAPWKVTGGKSQRALGRLASRFSRPMQLTVARGRDV